MRISDWSSDVCSSELLSGHYATLLRGTVRAMLPEHDVYVTDWRDARVVPLVCGGFDLDDFIGYIVDFIRIIGPDTHVIAVCQQIGRASSRERVCSYV